MFGRVRMAKLGILIAIPIFIALMVTSGPAEACGGDSGIDYLNDETVDANVDEEPMAGCRDIPEPMMKEKEPEVEIWASGFMLVNAVAMLGLAKFYL